MPKKPHKPAKLSLSSPVAVVTTADSLNMVMGQRIRNKRIEMGLTQAELGQQLNVSRQAVCNWEKGKVAPRYKVFKMEELFKVKPGWLFGYDDATNARITYHAKGKPPVTMRISTEHDQPILGTTAKKVKLYKVVNKIPPELYEVATELLESLIN